VAIHPSPEVIALHRLLAGRFSIERELGRGGMGIVLLARDVALDRPVAIKLLPAALADQPDLRERFLREARTAAKLSHPNIVPIHLVEAHDSTVFFVMTYVDGETLGQRVRRAGKLPASQVTRIVQEVAWALAYAHLRGIVHRDVKPDNILIDKDSGRAMVTDFGIARVADANTMSGSGEVVGTAHYMSPEQASGEAVDGRSDLFSLGITAFFALTGQLPFDGPHLPAIVTRIVTTPSPRVAEFRPETPAALSAAIDRCLAKSPADRFATGEELAAAVGLGVERTETAPQIRFLLKAMQGIDLFVGLLLAVMFAIPSVVSAMWATDRPTLFILAGLLVVLVGSQVYSMVFAARQAIKAGLGPADARRALMRESQIRREEIHTVIGGGVEPTPEMLLSRRPRLMVAANIMIVIALATVAAMAIGFIPRGVRGPAVGLTLMLSMIAFVLHVGAAGLKKQASLRAAGKRPTHLGITEGILGRLPMDWIFRLAGIGLTVEAQNAPPAAERTEVFVAGAADSLFARLSPELRRRFSEAPRIVARLRARAGRLRSRIEDSGRHGTEVADARARERLATTVAALEMIRLDLLKLETGTGSPDDLTADLEKARELGEAVDAELHGRDEVARLLAERRSKG
jgi:predicted Ser/Thr protein kinase